MNLLTWWVASVVFRTQRRTSGGNEALCEPIPDSAHWNHTRDVELGVELNAELDQTLLSWLEAPGDLEPLAVGRVIGDSFEGDLPWAYMSQCDRELVVALQRRDRDP